MNIILRKVEDQTVMVDGEIMVIRTITITDMGIMIVMIPRRTRKVAIKIYSLHAMMMLNMFLFLWTDI